VVQRGGEEGGSAGTARLRPLPRATARTRRSRPGPPGAGTRVEGDGGGNLVEEDTLRVAEKPQEPRAVGEAEGVDDSRSCGQGCRPMCAHEFVRIPEPKGGAPSSAGCDATTNKGGPDGHGEGRRVVCQG